MITNRVLEIILGILSFVVIPVQIVTTFVLGILIRLTFGLLLFPLSLIWVVLFLYPLIGLSYVYEKAPILRIPIAIIGIPIAVLGNTYASLIPSMGETESRISKLLLTESFPYTWHVYKLTLGSSMIQFTNGFSNLLVFFSRIRPDDKRWHYVYNLKRKNNI
jgi:hypothetical protein